MGHQARPDHLVSVDGGVPVVSVGVAYLPIPIGGALMILFVIERL